MTDSRRFRRSRYRSPCSGEAPGISLTAANPRCRAVPGGRGAVDTTARIIGNQQAEAAGQPFIIDNRAAPRATSALTISPNRRLTATPSCRPSTGTPLARRSIRSCRSMR